MDSAECGSEDEERVSQDGQYRPYSPGVTHAVCQGSLRHALCAVLFELSRGGPRLSWRHNPRAKTLNP